MEQCSIPAFSWLAPVLLDPELAYFEAPGRSTPRSVPSSTPPSS